VSTKAIVIHANPAVQEWVGGLKPEWDTQVPVTDAATVWDYLESGELSADSEILFISDLIFAEDPANFSAVVSSFAPTFLVIVTVEDPSLIDAINQSVADAVVTYGVEQGPYYFFDTSSESPVDSIDEIVKLYSEFRASNPESSVPAAEQTDVAGLESYDPVSPTVTPALVEEKATPAVAAPTTQFDGYTAEEIAQIENNLGEPGLIVSSTSSKGGSGKTTTAMCTAITIAQGARIASENGSGFPPLKVCVVDMDVRDGQIGFSINQTSPSILTLYVSEDVSIPTIKKNIIQVDRFEIDCLLAPKRGRTADYLTPQFYLDVLHKLRLMYDLIILDTSVNYLDPLLSQVVYPESDAILLVTNLSKGAVLGMPRWMEEITSTEDGGAGVAKEKIGVVINQSLGGVGMDLDLVRKAAKGAPLLVAIPADNRAVTKASNEGTLNELIRKHETIGSEYFKLATKIWRKTPLMSPLEDYLKSPEKARDDALAAKGKTDNSSAVSTFTPLSQASAPKRRFGRDK